MAQSPTISIDKVMQVAMLNSARLDAAEFRAKAAQSESEASFLKLLPGLSLNLEEDDSGLATQKYELSQTLWSGGRLTAQRDIASGDATVAEAELEDARLDILYEVMEAYFRVLRQTALFEQAQTDLAELDALVKIIGRRVDASISPELDRSISITRLRKAEIELNNLTQLRHEAVSRLEELTGESYQDYRFLTPSAIAGESYESAFEASLFSDPEYRRLLAVVERKEAELTLAQANLLPELKAHYVRRESDSPLAGDSESFSVSISFDTGNGFEKITVPEQRRLELLAAIEDVESFREAYALELKSLQLQIDSVRQSIPHLIEGKSLTAEILKSYRRLFDVGQKTWLDVLNAQGEFSAASRELIEADLELKRRTYELLLYVGQSDRFLQEWESEAGS